MNEQIERIKVVTEPLRQQIVNHKVYSMINDLEDLKIFMHYHIYAVWDFMSLLKALQSKLTCTTTPWLPVGNPEIRYLIHELVVAEETDIAFDGSRQSHFEMYLDAMKQCSANIIPINDFLENEYNKFRGHDDFHENSNLAYVKALLEKDRFYYDSTSENIVLNMWKGLIKKYDW